MAPGWWLRAALFLFLVSHQPFEDTQYESQLPKMLMIAVATRRYRGGFSS
jgi:hypothetical protein